MLANLDFRPDICKSATGRIEWHGRKHDYNSFTTTTKMAEIFEVRICRITEYLMLMNIFKYVSNYDPKPAKQQIEPAC